MAGRHASVAPSIDAALFGEQEWVEIAGYLELSPRQADIVALILRGKRDKQIAAALDLSVPTVRTYLSRIFSRMGVQDRVELILRVVAVSRLPRRPQSE